MQQVTQEIREHVLEKLDMQFEVSDEELEQIILDELTQYGRQNILTMREKEQLLQRVFNSIRRLDILQELLDDESITEVMVNGTNGIFFEKNGEIREWERHFTSREKRMDVVQQIAGASNRIVNESNPILDTRLSDGSRVNIVMEPASVDGAILSIRKFPKHPMTMEQLIQWGAIPAELVEFLSLLVKSGYNIFVSGGTGSGKTTFLNALSNYIPKQERVIVIEDSTELQIHGIPNLVRLETRQSRTEGVTPIDMRDLVKTSLRMRPDRIIVGEIRSGECLDLLQASNTGHRGTMSTGHSNSAADMLKRLETMVLMGMELPLSAIRGQIASGIDILVHLGRLRDRSRKVLEIVELDGMDGDRICLNPLYQFRETGEVSGKVQGEWVKQNDMKHPEKLWECGYHLSGEEEKAVYAKRSV